MRRGRDEYPIAGIPITAHRIGNPVDSRYELRRSNGKAVAEVFRVPGRQSWAIIEPDTRGNLPITAADRYEPRYKWIAPWPTMQKAGQMAWLRWQNNRHKEKNRQNKP